MSEKAHFFAAATMTADALPGDVWAIWVDVNGRRHWDEGISHAVIRGNFKAGATFSLTPHGSDPVEVRITSVTQGEEFSDEAVLPFGTIRTYHRMEPFGKYLQLTHEVHAEIAPEAADAFAKEIWPNMQSGLPKALHNIIHIAQAESRMASGGVVVTGLGVIAPIGIGVREFWNHALAGVSGIEEYSWGKTFGFKSSVLGRVKNFNASAHGITQRQRTGRGRYMQFALAAARMAMEDAGLNACAFDPRRLGVAVAGAIADAASMEENLLLLTDNGRLEADPRWVSQTSFDNFDFGMAAAAVAEQFGARGMVTNISTGCTAGLDALGFALDEIRAGNADIMLAGAAEAPLCPLSIGSFEALGALSTRSVNEARSASCPFSAERDGFIIAEGCGMLVLESREHALRRGARIYAELSGYASVNNVYHMTDLPPEGEALARCIWSALRNAECSPDEVDHISAHGSSTVQNDINETNAVKAVFGKRASSIPMNSLKSMTGHALAAANALEAVVLSLELHHQMIHPTVNYHAPDPACDLDYVPNAARTARMRSALKLSSGFSGIHSVIVMRAAA